MCERGQGQMSFKQPLRVLRMGVVAFCMTHALFAAEKEDPTTSGKALFQRQWQHFDVPSEGIDGLGPMHNDVSCVGCHFQGGLGGAGGIEKNIFLLSLDPRPPGMTVEAYREVAEKIHPGFTIRPETRLPRSPTETKLSAEAMRAIEKRLQKQRPKSLLILHKFSTDPEYTRYREQFPGGEFLSINSSESHAAATKMLAESPIHIVRKETINAIVSQRNTPALFGAGRIDSIDRADLSALALEQRRQGIVSGVASGKFGWKGQTRSLSSFVRDACLHELGLQLERTSQAISPHNTAYRTDGVDLSRSQLAAMTAFVSALPAPEERLPDDLDAKHVAQRGKRLFTKMGCAACHVETLGKVKKVHGIYSDLLLHDMGPSLADPVISGSDPRGGGGYGGNSILLRPTAITAWGVNVPENERRTRHKKQTTAQQEWRTPPLWGVRDSAPYLHDGRARSLTEAILYHGGEAKFSIRQFLKHSPADRVALLEFLHTLVAPGEDYPVRKNLASR